MHTRLLTNNIASHAAGKLASWTGGRLLAGKGAATLRIGQRASEVEALLGPPDDKRRFGDQVFYVYRDKGVDVDFGFAHPAGSVQRLIFYDANVAGHSQRPPVFLDKIGFGSSREEIIRVLGDPNLQGGPVRVANRKKTWICYASGFQFEFDARDRLIIIIVFDPRLYRAAK